MQIFNLHRSLSFHFFFFPLNLITLMQSCYFINTLANREPNVFEANLANWRRWRWIFLAENFWYLNIYKFSRTTFVFVHKLFLIIIIEWVFCLACVLYVYLCVCVWFCRTRLFIYSFCSIAYHASFAQTEQDAHSA